MNNLFVIAKFMALFSLEGTKFQAVWYFIFINQIRDNIVNSKDLCQRFNISKPTLAKYLKTGIDIFISCGMPDIRIERESKTSPNFILVGLEKPIEPAKKEPKKKTEKPKELKPDNAIVDSVDVFVNVVITHLNNIAGTRFSTDRENTKKFIKARIKEGFSIDNFKYVIEIKSKQWIGTEMEQYLRPETLFGNKFEGYLNEKYNEQRNTTDKRIESAKSAIDEDWAIR